MLRKLWTLVFAFASIFSLMALINLSAYAGRGQTNDFRTKVGPHLPAAGYAVNNLDDVNDGICDLNHCSLREAITAANSNAGADTITFSVSGTITLTSSLPPISDTLTIDGSGQNISISGAHAYQVITVNDGATLTLNALTIADGYNSVGGGIYNQGTLIVTNSTVANNLSHVNMFGDARGGGIDNDGTLTVTNSTFSNNIADFWYSVYCCSMGSSRGGAISNQGTLAVVNSTFSGNSAARTCTGDMLTGANDAPSGNNASRVDNPIPIPCECYGDGCDSQGGGIYNEGLATASNSLVANSVRGGSCVGTVVNGGNNLDSDGTCGWGSTNDSLSGINPHLGPLANHGGSTQTFSLWPDSPAIDGVTFNAPNGCPATDQRGVARPIGPRCDIGAYESNVMAHLFLPLIARNFVVALVVNRIAGDVSMPGW